jgi:NTE family protein
MNFLRLLFTLALLAAANVATAAADEELARPKIGLALSGGGARGAAHVGVLRVLEAEHVPVDYIAGTSMGAVIGGLYAAGVSVEGLERLLTEIDWADASDDRIRREDRSFRRKRDDDLYLVRAAPGIGDNGQVKFPAGLVQGQKIDLLLKSFTTAVAQVHNFDQLRIPFRAVAADIVTGEVISLGEGDLATAIRASMSIPAVLAPVEIDGRLLVDGGVSANLPIDVVRKMGADIVIAVDVTTELATREQLTSVLAIADQLTTLLTRRNSEAQVATLKPNDVLIAPQLGDIRYSDFARTSDAVERGDNAARSHSGLLSALALPEEQYAAYLKVRRRERTPPPTIDFVRIDNQSRLSDAMLSARLRVTPGEPLNVLELRRDIDRIYGLELFQTVNYELVRDAGRTGIELHVRDRAWGPNYLRFGMALSDNFQGDDFFNLAVAYTRTELNPLGGEWRTGLAIGGAPGLFSELYQPLDPQTRWFFQPSINLQEYKVPVFEGDDQTGELSLQYSGGGFAFGREFGTCCELRMGLRRFNGEANLRIGDPTVPSDPFDGGDFVMSMATDELDNRNFPRNGALASIEWRASREYLGADDDYDQARINYIKARTAGRYTFLVRAEAGTTFSGVAPVESLYRTGGFLNLSGLQQNALSGQSFGLLSVGTLRRLGDIAVLPAYIGTSVELGNAWQDHSDFGEDAIVAGSMYVGLDSFLGPLYVGYGRAEGGRGSFYFILGRVF